MDVSIAVSLMRGQMGAVVERAVNTAVETVLGEMLKVVGVKFEELKREMSTVKREMVAVKREKAAKEKENEEIRGRLQLSEMRLKYFKHNISSMGAREERRANPNISPCPNTSHIQTESPRALGLPEASSAQGRTPLDGSRPANGMYLARARDPQPPDSLLVSATSSFNDLTDMISHHVDDSLTLSSEDLGPKEELSSPLEGAGSLTRDDECESDWTSQQPTQASAPDPAPAQDPAPVPVPALEPDPAPALDPAPAPVSRAQTDGATGPAVGSRSTGRPQVKEEEVEVICIKEEPEEVASLLLDCERLAQGSQGGWTAAPPENGSFTHLTHHTPFSCSSPGTYALAQPSMSMSAAQRQVRAWPNDLSLYEEYKLRRAELRRHSLTRRREMEKALPQPMLADMVRERREKTRLRVARWRAKRKMQACLISQTGQVISAGSAQNRNTQSKAPPPTAASQQAGHALPPYGSLLFNRTHCDSASAYPGTSHFNSSPSSSLLMLGQNLVENVSHAAVTSTSSSSSSSSQPHPSLSLTDSDIFQ